MEVVETRNGQIDGDDKMSCLICSMTGGRIRPSAGE